MAATIQDKYADLFASGMEGTSSSHPGRTDATLVITYHPSPRIEVKVYHGSVYTDREMEKPVVYKNTCLAVKCYQPLENEDDIMETYRKEAPTYTKVLAPCGMSYLIESQFPTFEKNVHFCLSQIFEYYNVIEILLDTLSLAGFSDTRVQDILSEIMTNSYHEIKWMSMGDPLKPSMKPMFQALGSGCKQFCLRMKNDKKRLSVETIQDVMKRSIDIVRDSEIMDFRFQWGWPTKLAHMDLETFGLLGERPIVSMNFLVFYPSAVHEVVNKWMKDPVPIKRIIALFDKHTPVTKLMLMDNQTETAKKKAKKLLKNLGRDPLLDKFYTVVGIYEKAERFLVIEVGAHLTLHIYTFEDEENQPSTSTFVPYSFND